jgi:hypothetical protein
MTDLVRRLLYPLWPCRHERVRCIHGDEVLQAMTTWRARVRRTRCLDCGRALDRNLPNPCTTTGLPHASQATR